jgi:ankyrin repeat protein
MRFWESRSGFSGMIKAGADVNKQHENGSSPLYLAVAAGQDAVVRVLIEAGADVNKCRSVAPAMLEAGVHVTAGVTSLPPLHIVVVAGHAAVARTLIEAGADVNKAMMDDCTTPLFMAAQKGDETMVRVLIQAGADVSKAPDGGVTPLFTAA